VFSWPRIEAAFLRECGFFLMRDGCDATVLVVEG